MTEQQLSVGEDKADMTETSGEQIGLVETRSDQSASVRIAVAHLEPQRRCYKKKCQVLFTHFPWGHSSDIEARFTTSGGLLVVRGPYAPALSTYSEKELWMYAHNKILKTASVIASAEARTT